MDRAGHVFVGDFGFDLMAGGDAAAATLKRIDPDGSVTVVADDLHFPNGAVITADEATLIVGETLGNRYTAFDLAADGALSNRRVWAELGPLPTGVTTEEVLGQLVTAPDGCTLDADGHIWAADAVGARVVRIAPGGAIVDVVPRTGRHGGVRVRARRTGRTHAVAVLRPRLLRAQPGAGARGRTAGDRGRGAARRTALKVTRAAPD